MIMKISELIEKLNKVKSEKGDIEVYIKNGDDGGDYCGSRPTNDIEIKKSDKRDVVSIW